MSCSLLGAATSEARAADFDRKKYSGTGLKLLFNKHPCAHAMIADLDDFKSMTGMSVAYDVFPEEVYFDKVTAALSSKSNPWLGDQTHVAAELAGRLMVAVARERVSPGSEIKFGFASPDLHAFDARSGTGIAHAPVVP